jgi:beta-glucosidase
VGITINLYDVAPASDDPADVDAARRLDGQQNRLWLDALLRGAYPSDVVADMSAYSDFSFVHDGDLETISTKLDHLGINYYSSFVTRHLDEPVAPAAGARPLPWLGLEDVELADRGLPRTHMGWDVDPDGLRKTLERVSRDYDAPPIYVTENGAAYEDVVVDGAVDDPERSAYVDAHLRACLDAMDAGVDLRGYFVWSLLDNFEWAWGYTRRFGVIRVDYDTQERIVKASARAYSAIARDNGWV